MFNSIKKVIGISLAVVWGVVFLVMPSYAFMDDTNGNHSGGADSKMTGNAEGRGVATFSMNFSASANTKGNFDADAEGSMQNMFAGEGRDYYYNPSK